MMGSYNCAEEGGTILKRVSEDPAEQKVKDNSDVVKQQSDKNTGRPSADRRMALKHNRVTVIRALSSAAFMRLQILLSVEEMQFSY